MGEVLTEVVVQFLLQLIQESLLLLMVVQSQHADGKRKSVIKEVKVKD